MSGPIGEDIDAACKAWNDLSEPPRSALDLQAVIRLYNTGYHAGHEDTVESAYTDIQPCDMDTYHKEEVKEIIDDMNHSKRKDATTDSTIMEMSQMKGGGE